MKNVPLLIGTLLLTVAIVIGMAMLFSQPEEVVIVDSSIVVKEDRPVKGATESAKVTIVEFSDFQCPTCRAYAPMAEEVIAKYPNDVRFIYRHFPLNTIHPNAQKAAQAAEAARGFDKFWEMHDLLFEEQIVWANLSSADFDKKLEEYAEKLQIDKSEFQKRIESNEVKEVVTTDYADGVRAGVDGTPTFFINGKSVSAPQPLLPAVEAALSENSN
jgi:protein-disulfide isomerase